MPDSVDPSKISYVQIFPPLGVARLGDSGFDLDTGKPDGEIEYFISPEIPGTEDLPDDPSGRFTFRDSKCRVKRQAVRFRVYAYDSNGTNLGEITSAGDSKYTLKWTVHVANHKASYYEFSFGGFYDPNFKTLRNPDVQPDAEPEKRTNLIIDAKEQQISGKDQRVNLEGEFYGSQTTATKVNLGELRTDESGRLIFIGGPGYSRSVANPAMPHFQPDILSPQDSIDWVDDVCDGWVDVHVTHPDRVNNPIPDPQHKSTVFSAPPKFAWGVHAPTSLHDVVANIYKNVWKDHDNADFYQDIWPVLRGAYVLSWVNVSAYEGHGVGGKGNFLLLEDRLKDSGESTRLLREHVFNRIRASDPYPKPDDRLRQASSKFMPRLSGDSGWKVEPGQPFDPKEGAPSPRQFAAMTGLQYDRFRDWQAGNFTTELTPWHGKKNIDEVELKLRPTLLTRAALDQTIGEPLYPGIEMHWIIRQDPTMFIVQKDTPDEDPPFRVNHDKFKPGFINRGLCLPWQSDFYLCNTSWWPSGRPDDVFNIQDLPSEKLIAEETFLRDVNPKRNRWDRGMRGVPGPPVDPIQYWPGSTDMVRFWQKLGFLRKLPDVFIGNSDMKLPIWVEDERMNINRTKDKTAFQLPFVS